MHLPIACLGKWVERPRRIKFMCAGVFLFLHGMQTFAIKISASLLRPGPRCRPPVAPGLFTAPFAGGFYMTNEQDSDVIEAYGTCMLLGCLVFGTVASLMHWI